MDTPFAELDALYIKILSSVTDVEKTLTILGFLIFSTYASAIIARSMDTEFLDDFLMLSEGDSLIFSADLASVLILGRPERNGHRRVELLHASLGDFLLDRSRSNQFALDPAGVHAQISCMCFRALSRDLNLPSKLSQHRLVSLVIHTNSAKVPCLGYLYARESLIMHCSAAAPTAALQNAIMGFSVDSYPQYQGCGNYLYGTALTFERIRR